MHCTGHAPVSGLWPSPRNASYRHTVCMSDTGQCNACTTRQYLKSNNSLGFLIFLVTAWFAHPDTRCERSKVKRIPNTSQQAAFHLDSCVYATGQAVTWVKTRPLKASCHLPGAAPIKGVAASIALIWTLASPHAKFLLLWLCLGGRSPRGSRLVWTSYCSLAYCYSSLCLSSTCM